MGTAGLIVTGMACVAGIVWGTRELMVMDAQEKEEAVRKANREKLHGMMTEGDTVVHYTTAPKDPYSNLVIFRPAKPRKGCRGWGK